MDAEATFSCSFGQFDLESISDLPGIPRWPAHGLPSEERHYLAVQVLAGRQPVPDFAPEHDVSRKFLYQQPDPAKEARTQAFAPDPTTEDVLFQLPVTKAWSRQLALGFVLIGHSPYRA